jgi:membrane-associated phospholipid phosphatase
MSYRTFALIILLGWAPSAAAQTNSIADFEVNNTQVADTTAATQTTDKPQQPTAAAGEAAKPTRGFVSALGHNLLDDTKHIPRRNSLYFLAGGIGLALAVHPIDHSLNAHLAGRPNYFVAGQYIGSAPAILGAGFAAYLFGRVESERRTQHLGMDEIEAALISEAVVEVSKEIIRRPRPSQTGGLLASGFSMPSGHATMTFAAATVLQQHLGYKAAIPTYIFATYVAMSRLHDNVHYASDVVMGAATGIIIGRSVTWHGRNFYGQLMPTPGGVGVGFATR